MKQRDSVPFVEWSTQQGAGEGKILQLTWPEPGVRLDSTSLRKLKIMKSRGSYLTSRYNSKTSVQDNFFNSTESNLFGYIS